MYNVNALIRHEGKNWWELSIFAQACRVGVNIVIEDIPNNECSIMMYLLYSDPKHSWAIDLSHDTILFAVLVYLHWKKHCKSS